MKKRVKFLTIAAVTVLAAVIAVAGYKVVAILNSYQEAEDEYAQLQELVKPGLETSESATAVPTAAAPDETDASDAAIALNSATASAQTAATALPASTTPAAATDATRAAAATQPTAATQAPTPTAARGAAATQAVSATAASGLETAAAQIASMASAAIAESDMETAAETAAETQSATAAPDSTSSHATQPAGATALVTGQGSTLPPAGGTPTPTPEPLIQMDFTPLLAINEDAVAWISIADTAINYPVVLGDDNIFYLKRLFSGDWGFSGSIFMDFENKGDFSDKNTVIFGHHMNNGTMFAGLSDFLNQEYFDLHPTMMLYTPAGDYRVDLFAAYNRDASAISHDFDTPEDFLAYVAELKTLSIVSSAIEIGPEDRIITLSTCSYVYDDARLVLIGKLVPLYK